jgi:hypothetical protein
MSHHTYERLVRLEGGAADFTLGSLLAKGRDELGSDAAAVEFSRDVMVASPCSNKICPRPANRLMKAC